MKISEEAISIIQRYEGCELERYTYPAGRETIGYGHVIRAGEHLDTITQEQADELLMGDVAEAAGAVSRMVSVPLNENQLGALTSWVFNLGAGNFRGSTLRALVNRKSWLQAAEEFPRWNYAGGRVLAGLTVRRAEERSLFLRPVLVKDAWNRA